MKTLLKNIKDAVQGKAKLGQARNPKWQTVRKKHIKMYPKCAVCSGTNKLEVHHIKPFHEHPELELDPKNLITLCESKSSGVTCHLFFGHLGSYKTTNPNVRRDSRIWNQKLKGK